MSDNNKNIHNETSPSGSAVDTRGGNFAVIMAGGIGSRFWPVSTAELPKQFHDLLGSGQTLIQKTFSRLEKIIPTENILILTNERYKDLVLEQLPAVKEEQLVLEPAMRNTAPCILLSALKIYKKDPNAIMLVAPSDHWIEDEDTFGKNISTAFQACKNEDILMTLGIKPTFANTGYGYIKYNKDENSELKQVEQFTEKPDYNKAREFLEQGNYLWNAGIFIWSAKSIINSFQSNLPDMYSLFFKGFEDLNSKSETGFIEDNYSEAENISIDYGILEKAGNVFTIEAEFDWNDLGTWGSLHDKLPKDVNNNAVVRAKTILINAGDNIIQSDFGKQIVISDLNGYIVVDTEKTLIIVPKEKEQEIKQIQEMAKNRFSL